jgi:hypothetical protein
MRCANPECGIVAHDLTRGILRLVEMKVPPETRVTRSEWGFPICTVPSRYFWLCDKCSEVLNLRGWTEDGLIFDPIVNQVRGMRTLPEPRLPAQKASPSDRFLVRQSA